MTSMACRVDGHRQFRFPGNLFNEPERRTFNEAIEAAETRVMSAATFVKVSIVIESRFGAEGIRDLDLFIERAGLEIATMDAEQVNVARRALSRFGKGHHEARLNYGDFFSYALAFVLGEPLLYKGEDFGQIESGRLCRRSASKPYRCLSQGEHFYDTYRSDGTGNHSRRRSCLRALHWYLVGRTGGRSPKAVEIFEQVADTTTLETSYEVRRGERAWLSIRPNFVPFAPQNVSFAGSTTTPAEKVQTSFCTIPPSASPGLK